MQTECLGIPLATWQSERVSVITNDERSSELSSFLTTETDTGHLVDDIDYHVSVSGVEGRLGRCT